MLSKPILFLLCARLVQSVVLNTTCPEVEPRKLDWKELDGKWYIAAMAADHFNIEGACVTLVFNHSNYTDVSVSWTENNMTDFYNGTVAINSDPNSNSSGDLLMITYSDGKAETYKFLDVDYQHYAVMFSCEDGDDGNSSVYEIWKMIRSPIMKASDAVKINEAIANYNLQDTIFTTFNNSEEICSESSSGNQLLDSSTLVLTSAAAYALFRRLY
ncbi:lazarillo protein-like [Plodia interpunctella]|uniref:lazarillo protein-like n=1 Tax=Plodia interpunctella TaxID=58824 RepID=UPI002368D3B6|nr:lazarillo protein-like [Plodia interpunctella]